MIKKPVCQPTRWDEFGRFIAGAAVIGGVVGFIYLLFIVPYERHKDTMYKLDRIDQTTVGHYEQYQSGRYYEQRRKE